MDSSTKKVLLGCGIGCVVLVILVVVAGYLIWSRAIAPTMKQVMGESDVGPVGVSVGNGLLTSSVFADQLQNGAVTDISIGKVDPNPKVALAVAGDGGASLLSRDGKVVSSVAFSEPMNVVQIVDVEKDGTCEFMSRGGFVGEPSLRGHDGAVRWNVKRQEGAIGMAAGDVDGDAKGKEVRLLDRLGRERWRQSEPSVLHVEVADVLGQGRPSIVDGNGMGQFTVRDANGNFVPIPTSPSGNATRTMSDLLMDFTTIPWPATGRARILAASADRIRVLDISGAVLATLNAPGSSGMLAGARATWVHLQPKAPPYLAVLVTSFRQIHSLLYLYDSQQKLAYREVLPARGSGLAVLPGSGKQGDALLVGQEGRVLKYVAKGAPAKGK